MAGTTDEEDSILNFSKIKFEWSDDHFEQNVYVFEKVRHDVSSPTTETHDASDDIVLTSGVYSVNRQVDGLLRKYTFDLDESYLGSNYATVDRSNVM